MILLPCCSLVFVAFAVAASAAAVRYPLKVSSANPRLLVDQNNAPFLLVGDAPHALVVNLSTADAARFLEDRRTNGFNSMWVEVIVEDSEAGRADGSLLDGTTPFTNTLAGGFWDLTTPNEAYFAHVDTIVRLAATNGIQLLLNPLDTGGWTDSALANGPNRCRAYGQYLGGRYKDFPNILWLHGNDFQTWRTADDDAAVSAIAKGIRDTDTNHLQTVQLDFPVSGSLDSTNWAPIVKVDSVYSYYAQYERVLRDYQNTNAMPVVMVEGHYEYQTNYYGDFGTIPVLRRQMYWSLLSGAVGHCYGNDAVWPFGPGWDSPAILNSPAIAQLRYVTMLFQSRRWQAFVPDISHTVLTAGFGTYATNAAVGSNNYATCAREINGETVMVYAPTQRAMTINMTRLAGTDALAWWFDPQTGTATNFGSFATTGTQVFTPPDTNDWVLVLDNAVNNFPAPGSAPLTQPLQIVTGLLTNALVGSNYSTLFYATGGTMPYSWSLAPGSAPLPGGLSLGTNGLLAGTPTTAATFQFTALATDAEGVIATNAAELVVSPAQLTVTAWSINRIYGATNPVLTGSLDGLLPSDSITASFSTTATPGSPVGVYPVSVSLSAPGGQFGNYILTINGGNLIVTPAALLITVGSTSKVYGSTLNPADYTVSGLVNSDSVTNVILASAGGVSNAPIGGYPIVASDVAGVGLTNYTISYSNGTLTVNAASLLITAGSTKKMYGTTLHPVDYTTAGLVNGDSVTNVSLSSPGSGSLADIGNYPITVGAVNGAGLTNYLIGYSNGTLTVGLPQLVIAPVGTNEVELSWLAPPPTFALEAKTDLASTNWLPVTDPVLLTAGGSQVVQPATNATRFYRLIAVVSNEAASVISPQLAISPHGADGVALNWAGAGPAFALEANMDLTTANWVTVTNPLRAWLTGTNLVVLPATNRACYFRLKLP